VTKRERRFGPISWLQEWARSEIEEIVLKQLRRPLVQHEDPLRLFAEQEEEVKRELLASANVVGSGVMVGRGVVMWGGKFSGGVGIELRNHVRIYEHCRLVVDQVGPQSGIVLEERVAMNFGCYIEGSGGVLIGQRTVLGPNVVIVSSGHRIDPEVPVQSSGKNYGAVSIGEDVWIGANAVVLSGITVGNRAVIGAGSVVTQDVPARSVVAGNPAHVLRSIDQR
jgi:acetyltransferase-like isoleucine patch superfamily enzyme